MREKSLRNEIFPNIGTALRIFVSVPVGSVYRSYYCRKIVSTRKTKKKRFKIHPRPIEKWNNLALISIENMKRIESATTRIV